MTQKENRISNIIKIDIDKSLSFVYGFFIFMEKGVDPDAQDMVVIFGFGFNGWND